MRHQYTFAKAVARRFVVALGLAAALGSATVIAGSAARASDGVGREVAAAAVPSYRLVPNSVSKNDCPIGYMCLWTGDHFTGRALFMLGAGLARCQGYRFEGTPWQDNVGSIWNRLQGGPSSVWNRRSDGSYHYSKITSIGTGYQHDTAFSRSMDAFVWDPAGTCRTLSLFAVG